MEVRKANFFKCLNDYVGGIHLVYGEKDKFMSKVLRNKVIEKVRAKNQPYLVLKGQDHSPWEYELVQKVYSEELELLGKYI